jgi:hypothetical protein
MRDACTTPSRRMVADAAVSCPASSDPARCVTGASGPLLPECRRRRYPPVAVASVALESRAIAEQEASAIWLELTAVLCLTTPVLGVGHAYCAVEEGSRRRS